MNDLVKRLRCYAAADTAVWHPWVYRDSADRIEAQAFRIERQDARITELKAEVKFWWDENFKKQTACEQMAARIAELEAALQWFVDNDETIEGDTPMSERGGRTWNEINAYWIEGLNLARDLLKSRAALADKE